MRRILRGLLAAAVLPWIFGAGPSHGRDEVIFENLSLQEGLSQTTVRAILMDRTGYMWFGTNGGLNRYDGYQFKTYRHRWGRDDGLTDNSVTSLAQDGNGDIWVGTMGGLNRIDHDTGQIRRYLSKDGSGGLGDDGVTSLKVDRCGSLWIGTRRGLCRKDPGEDRFISMGGDTGAPTERVNALAPDRSGRIWAGTELGLYGGDKNGFRFYSLPLGSRQDREITAILEDHRKRLWVGTRAGKLYRFDRETTTFTVVPSVLSVEKSRRSIIAIYEDIFGELWIGTDGGGILRINPDSGTISVYRKDRTTPHGLRDDVILSIWGDTGESIHFGDLTGVIWFGSFSNGIEKVHLKRPFQRYDSRSYNIRGLVGEDIRALWKNGDGTLWAGTLGGGLKEIDGKTNTVTHWYHDDMDPYSIGGDRVLSLLGIPGGALLAGTSEGLDVFSHGKFEPVAFPGAHGPLSVGFLLMDSRKTVWIGTDRGLFNLDGDRAIPFAGNDRLSPWSVTSIAEDESGTLWIGTDGEGLFSVKAESGFPRRPDAGPQTISSRIYSLFCWKDELWVGTDLGLQVIRKDLPKTYTSEDGLPGDVIKAILRDRYGQLWLSTDNGLCRLDPKNGEIRNYSLGDGLQGKEFNRGAAIIDGFGKMYFGGTKGCNSFYPSNISENDHVPPVVINDVSVFGEPVEMQYGPLGGRRVVLSHRQNYITIHFAALDYTAPEANEYRYILDGFDENWIYSGNRNDASYTNLPDGKYVFRVIGSNNNGIWNEVGAELEIEVIPPFWRTPLAYGVYICCAGAMGYFSLVYGRNRRDKETERRLRIVTERSNRQLLEKNRQLELARRHESLHRQRLRYLATALTEAEERERRKIAAEVHDSIGQTLALSKLKLEMLRQSVPNKADREISSVTAMLDQTIRSTRTLTFELGTPVLYRFGFFPALERLSESFEEDYGISIHTVHDGPLPSMNDDMKAFLFRAVRELAMNAVKHANPSRLTIFSKARDDKLYLSVSDDGTGFDPSSIEALEDNRRSFGLFSLRERIISLGGRMAIRSVPGQGTSVKLLVPLVKEG